MILSSKKHSQPSFALFKKKKSNNNNNNKPHFYQFFSTGAPGQNMFSNRQQRSWNHNKPHFYQFLSTGAPGGFKTCFRIDNNEGGIMILPIPLYRSTGGFQNMFSNRQQRSWNHLFKKKNNNNNNNKPHFYQFLSTGALGGFKTCFRIDINEVGIMPTNWLTAKWGNHPRGSMQQIKEQRLHGPKLERERKGRREGKKRG